MMRNSQISCKAIQAIINKSSKKNSVVAFPVLFPNIFLKILYILDFKYSAIPTSQNILKKFMSLVGPRKFEGGVSF